MDTIDLFHYYLQFYTHTHIHTYITISFISVENIKLWLGKNADKGNKCINYSLIDDI